MEVFNTTPYAVFPFDTSLAPELPSATLIVRGTFALRPDQPALPKPAKEQRPPRGDEAHLDDLGRSLAYATDLVPTKVRGEVLVRGTCHTPDGVPRPSHDVSIQVGAVQKSLRVTGPRVFVDDGGRLSIGRTAPFTIMPLRWELAFGGMAFAQNPLGRGIEQCPDDDGRPIHPLPCIEYPNARMGSSTDRPPPAGLGPISPSWMPRAKQAGTRDQRWALFRAPLPPKDFDPGFYNAAPADQQLKKGYFQGDEPVVLTGMHKTRQRFASALPGKRLRAFVVQLVEAPATTAGEEPLEEPRFVEVPMSLDTVYVDADKAEMVLVWRGPLAPTKSGLTDLAATYVAEEDLVDSPATLEEHEARFNALLEPAPVPDAPVDVSGPTEEELAKEKIRADAIELQLAEVKKTLEMAKIDPKIIAEVEKTKDPVKLFDLLESHTWEKIRELEAMTAKMKG